MGWGGFPARAMDVLDRLLLPRRAFDPQRRRMGLLMPLLSGRSARLILASDKPGWAYRLLHGQALRRQIASQIMGFVGIRPMAFTHFSPVERSTAVLRQEWLDKVHALGWKAA
ncbi:MAG: hypothetical protein RLY86_4421 [Pseudomonadota bacterium]|jgi:putative NADPH-quinone reductase